VEPLPENFRVMNQTSSPITAPLRTFTHAAVVAKVPAIGTISFFSNFPFGFEEAV
jgi:hypothetical protein